MSVESLRPLHDIGAAQQLLDHRAHGGGAEHQRLLAAAAVEHAVGEDVAAVEVGAELHLVDGDEGEIEIARHGLDGRHPVARVRRLDLLLAGDQRDVLGADPVDDLVVDLARQQPQRQPDHAGRVPEHPLDGEMGLAGVGRAEHGGHAGATQAAVAGHRRRERNRHPFSRLGWPASARGHAFVYHNATPDQRALNRWERVWNEPGPNRRLRALYEFRSPRHLARLQADSHNIG